MSTDIKRPLRRVQASDDLETRLVDRTLRLLSVLQGNTDLIAPFRVLVGLENLYWLGKVVLDEVEECVVVLLLNARVVYDEGTVCDDRSSCLIKRGSRHPPVDRGMGYDDAGLTLSHSTRALEPPARKTSMSIIGSVAVESAICFPVDSRKLPNRERRWLTALLHVTATAPLTHDQHIPLDNYPHHLPTMIRVCPFHSSSAVVLTQPQIWSMKKTEEAAAKKKPKTSAAQIRVQKGGSHPSIIPV